MSDVEKAGAVVGVGALILGALRACVPLLERLIDSRERSDIRAEDALAARLTAAEARIVEIESLAALLAIERAELARRVAAYEETHGHRRR